MGRRKVPPVSHAERRCCHTVCVCNLALLLVLLCDELFFGGYPIFVCAVFPVVQEPGLEDVGEVHLSNKAVDFIGVGDDDKVVLAFGLPTFELMGKGRDVVFRCVTPRLVEEGLHIELLIVGNDVPSPELLDHRRDGLILVPDIVFG